MEMRSATGTCCWLSLISMSLLVGCAAPTTQRIAIDPNARAREEQIQREIAVKALTESQFRVLTVGWAVLRGAAQDCGDRVRPSLGFTALSRDRIPAESRQLLSEALGVDDKLRVFVVSKGSSAEDAGMKVGDVIVTAVPPSPPGESREAARQRLNGPLLVGVLRDNQQVVLTVSPQLLCDYPLKVVPGSQVNAFADGEQIVLTSGMVRFAASDRELALVIGHELGHNTMGHLNKKKSNMAVGAIFDILAAAYRVNTQGAFANLGATAYSQDFESEADYVGLYYLARAGYDTTGAASFWRRMAAENPGNINTNHAASHPATAERFLAIEQATVEVTGKQTNGLPLMPNLKPEASAITQPEGSTADSFPPGWSNAMRQACLQGVGPCPAKPLRPVAPAITQSEGSTAGSFPPGWSHVMQQACLQSTGPCPPGFRRK